MNFFDLKRPVSLNLSFQEQREKWMPQFLKAFYVVFIAYFASYIIRNNMDSAMVAMKLKLGLSKEKVGHVLFFNTLAYGLGKTALGFLVDRRNSKKIMNFLIMLGGFCNIGVSILFFSGLEMKALLGGIGFIWAINGLVLSPGGPCAYSTIMRWMPKSKQATWLGRWNVSHNIGGAFAAGIAAWFADNFFGGNVGGFFLIPGLFGVAVGIWGMFYGKDDPMELGWDDAATVWEELDDEEKRKEEEKKEVPKSKILFDYVLKNPWVWLLALANVFVYMVRMGVSTWVTYYAKVVLGHELKRATILKIAFEMSALVGSLFLGWFSDKVKGRRMLVSGIIMLLTSAGVWYYSKAEEIHELIIAMVICGFFIFGPQLLIGVSVVKFVPKKAVAVANGVTGTAGYLIGDSLIKEKLPKWIGGNETREVWNKMFVIMYVCIIIGAIVMFIIAVEEERRIRKDQAFAKK
ncbi:MAG: MFS transporter [Streptococcaceae bacterium]|nr:MFS transporter [Streptococcaceae bacterium]